MRIVTQSQIEGEFEGMDFDRVFKLANGQAWQQAVGQYRYTYHSQPSVRVLEEGGRHVLDVDGFGELIAVRRV